MGIILSGAGIGGLVFSPLIRTLLSALGPRWTLRALSLLNLVISLPIAVTAAPSRFVGRRPTRVSVALATKPAFVLSVLAGFLQAGGNGLPLTFLAEYSVALGYSAGFGATLLAVSNGVNSVSRVVTGYVGDRCGRQNTLILNVVLCVVSVLGFWLGSTGEGGSRTLWVLFVVFYGVAGGGYNALFPTVCLSLSPSISPFSLNHQIITAILTPPDHRRSLWPPSLRQRQRLHLLCPRPRPDFWKSRWRQDIRREQAGELQERCVVRCGASWGCCALRDWC